MILQIKIKNVKMHMWPQASLIAIKFIMIDKNTYF